LTPREWEVLELLRQGRSNEEIAQELGITVRGARYHVSETLSKLGVSNREAAAAWRSEPQYAPILLPLMLGWKKFLTLQPLKAAAIVAIAIPVVGLCLLIWGIARVDDVPATAIVLRATPTPATTIVPRATPTPPSCQDFLYWAQVAKMYGERGTGLPATEPACWPPPSF
jgi:DNA-binding CsgD family transcriptional regulator